MSNMSYCRFQNTLQDMIDCREAIEAALVGDEQLSGEEIRAAADLFEVCSAYVQLCANAAGQSAERMEGDAVIEAIDRIEK